MTASGAEPYYALALQLTCRAVSGFATVAEGRASMLALIDALEKQIAVSRAFIGEDLRLVVLPEYFLSGYPLGEGVAEWGEKAALAPDGPEYGRMGEICRRLGIYLAGNAYELDEHFPNLYFQTSFLVDDAGEVVLRYRRLNSLYAPTPHDVWDRYLEIYGLDGVFPVARTPLGNLAAVASEEILYPEVARAMVLRGAEVLLHSTSEVYGDGSSIKDVAKRSRAAENLAYVLSANSAGIDGTSLPMSSTDGGSKLVGYQGQIFASAGPGESMSCYGEVDLGALRRYRRRPGIMNFLSRQRPEIYAEVYDQSRVWPANTIGDGPIQRSHFRDTQLETIRRLAQLGLI